MFGLESIKDAEEISFRRRPLAGLAELPATGA